MLVLQYLIIVPAAYSFARHEYFGKNIFFGIVLLGLMIPQQITFLPVYLMFSRMKMLKTFIPLILPFISNPFGIFMLRQYFMQIPQEVIEAARLDDADNRKIMFKVTGSDHHRPSVLHLYLEQLLLAVDHDLQ